MKKINSIDYLRNVIKNWRSFSKGHRLFVQAIDDVLKLVNYQETKIEMLNKEIIVQQLKNNMLYETTKEVKSEAINEFSELFKKRIKAKYPLENSDVLCGLIITELDYLVKEMTDIKE